MNKKGSLVFFCGKMGSGKSTKARELVSEVRGVLLSEDDWLSALFPNEIGDFNDYLKYSQRVKMVIKKHVGELLNNGLTVILDFPGNTKKQRSWFMEIINDNKCHHRLIYLEAGDDLCLKRIGMRRVTEPKRTNFDNEEVFYQVTSYFNPPSIEEGFNIQIISQ